MTRLYAPILGLLLLATWAHSDPPKLTVPAEVKPTGQYCEMVPQTDAVSVTYVGLDGVEPIPSHWLNDRRAFRLDARGLAKGRYRFAAIAAGQKGEQSRADFALVIGDAPGPAPGPGPGPGPEPPAPDKAPIPEPGFRVLVVYEKSDLTKLTPQQHSILYGAELREYLQRKCAVGPDGKTTECRFYDQHTDMTHESALWQAAMRRPRTALPWLIVSNGKSGFEGPLPSNVADTMKILKQHGGE